MASKEHWHVDKRVPIALIFAIIMQTGGAFWWASDISGRVARLEDENKVTEAALTKLVEMTVHLGYMQKSLEDIRDFLKNDVEWVRPTKE